ncbi:hypothetical protein ADIS_0182 [Lunatimonas lonarensis]|uniref:Uncharacterized protein n=1 Tax=Lunatimonas lonarensis TaxID=1232681 RepID=R7ZYX9_9BACT|nr:hypothetical protein ADIS_0182 [Lunatimonas lonarensis]
MFQPQALFRPPAIFPLYFSRRHYFNPGLSENQTSNRLLTLPA